MSMSTLTILQLIEIFAVYTVVTVLIPAAVFYKKVSGMKLTVRFMIYITIGNFYIMNLVFFLQLLHISNRYTLLIFTLVPAVIAMAAVNRIPVREILNQIYDYAYRIMLGRIGFRSLCGKISGSFTRQLKRLGTGIWTGFRRRSVEWLLFIGLMGYLLWIYGTNALHTYGYSLTDVPVHNYWINAMSDNDIFVQGIYPFGFHCIIYYVHIVFGIDTYVLLRLFWLIQTLYVHLVLFAFIKACCRTRFAAYLGTGIYIAVNIFQMDCTSRYFSTLPQEFGMIFILPGIYFALAFFFERKKEIGTRWDRFKKLRIENEKKKQLRTLPLKKRLVVQFCSPSRSSWYLIGYALSFSMTLSVHFYDTIIAGLFCVAIAIAFSTRFFNTGYFFRVMGAFIISIFIAVLPMAIAYAAGTPLQASLNWGMNVMKGEDEAENETTSDQLDAILEEPKGEVSQAQQPPFRFRVEEYINRNRLVNEDNTDTAVIPQDRVIILDDWIHGKLKAAAEKADYYIKRVYQAVDEMADMYLANNGVDGFLRINLTGMAVLLLLALVYFSQKRFDYGSLLIAGILYTGFLFFLLGSGKLGLPELMDYNRCRIFLAYSLPIIWSFLADAVVYTVFGHVRKRWILSAASLGVCCGLGLYSVSAAPVRTYEKVDGLEMNQAITCLSNIIHENKDFTWTIVSANDELNMVVDHGYHYEIIDFLNKMEYTGYRGVITIPTRYVYFFIEKVPLDYMLRYEGSGQAISETGAKKSLPQGSSLSIYQGEDRWIVMSRMYYWARAYQKLYSNEMNIYYEDEMFICYRIEQNEYSLNNFAIDYDYNLPEAAAE